MMGTRIVLDEDKIQREGTYDLEKIYQAIDDFALKCDLIKKDKYTYMCRGDKQDLSNLGLFTHQGLLEMDWFTDNLKEWYWIEDGEEEDMMSDIAEIRNYVG